MQQALHIDELCGSNELLKCGNNPLFLSSEEQKYHRYVCMYVMYHHIT